MPRQYRQNIKAIYLLWSNWAAVSGAISLLVLLSLWVKPVIMPLVAFALQMGCYWLISVNRRREVPVCILLPHIAVRILFISGFVMLLLDILMSRHIVTYLPGSESLNAEIPFITVLIVAPVTALCTALYLLRRSRASFCQECKATYGTPAERGFLGRLFSQEGVYQAKMLCLISAIITVIAWGYYFICYVNVNLSAPDTFIFFIAPILLFVFSIIYMALRYAGLWDYYSNVLGAIHTHTEPSSLVRFLIIWDNYLAVVPPESNPDKVVDPRTNRYDIPVEIFIPERKELSAAAAATLFHNKTNVSIADTRFMYSTLVGNADHSLFHYLCYPTDSEKEQLIKAIPSIEFLSLGHLREMINSNSCNPMLSAEIVRLHTMAMAWKTYDCHGKRLYKIKNYVPTFRLRDIHKWAVDYNDPLWLRISHFNQDSPLFSLRRLWHKYFSA